MIFIDALNELDIETEVVCFNNPIKFIEHYVTHGNKFPELVFLDLNIPAMNGFDFLEEMKKRNLLKNLSVVIYSTSSSEKDIEKCFLLGANVYLKKPNDFQTLKKSLQKVLQMKWHYTTSNLNINNFILKV